ncbi:MAG: c-type cytochrome domain-containing protein [Chthoniobacteraceae bacterium]
MIRHACTARLFAAATLSLTPVMAAGAEIDFYRDVYPVLKANCISCHNKTTTKGGLNMESPELMRKGGETGPGAVPGKGAESLIVRAAAHEDDDLVMPPKKNKAGAVELTSAEVGLLKTWIDQGAKHSVQQARQIAWQPLPPGVNPIYAVAMTKDGRFAACSRANQIFIYDLATRQFITRVTDQGGVAHRALVQSLAFSPDGTRLASGSFREVKIWRLEKAKPAVVGTKSAAAAQASGALLRKIAESGKVIVVSHALSPDAKQIATGCADGSVRVWDVATAKPIIELLGSVRTSQQIAALERTLAAQSLEQLFQKSETTRIEAQNKALDELLKKANGTIVAMKKALPEKEKAVKPAQEAKTAALKVLDEIAAKIAREPDGKKDGALEKQQKEAHDKLASTTMAETSALAAFAAVESNIRDAEADVKRITGTKAKNAGTLAMANSANEAAKKIQDRTAAELAAVKQTLAKGGAKPVAVAFSADAQKVAALLDDGKLNVWAVASGIPIGEIGDTPAATTALASGGEGSFTATKTVTFATGTAPHWVLERVLSGDAFADRVNAVRFSPDGKTIAAGGGEPSRSGDISLWDVATGKLVKSWPERHSDAVLCLDFSPDGKLLASGGADKIARVTDIATGKQVQLFEGHTHHVMGVAFRADGRVLASAGGDGVVLVWDMILGERKKKIVGWDKEVTSLQFIGATSQIVTSAGDNIIRIVNDDGTQVRSMDKLPDFMQSAASTASASVVIGGGEDSEFRVWDGTNGKELAVFGAK